MGVSAQAIGIATAAFDEAKAWAFDASRTHDPRGAEWRRLLADAKTELEASWALCLRAARLKDMQKPLTQEAAVSKLFCTESANRICQNMLTIVGNDDSQARRDIERYMRDVRVTRIYEGTSEVQRIVIAREVFRKAGKGAM